MPPSRKNKKLVVKSKSKIGCGCQSGGANNTTKKNNSNKKQNVPNTAEPTATENNASANKSNPNKTNTNKPANKPANKTNKHTNQPALDAATPAAAESKKFNISKLKPSDVDSMTNEEIEALIQNNPDMFANITKDFKAYQTAKNNAETAKLEQEVVQLDKKIKNSSQTISSIMDHITQQEKDRTSGYYVIGINIPAILNYLFKNTSPNTNSKKSYKKRFQEIGEYYDVNPDEIDMLKPRLIEQSKRLGNTISNNTKFENVAALSKEYNTSGNITPAGLLQMTRMLFQSKKDEKQWLRVVELIELIYNNVGKFQDLTREEFFNQKTPIGLDLITELGEIYNTQHIFTDGKSSVSGEAYEFYSRQV